MTRAREPFLVRHAAIIFSAKTFAASMAALLIALWMDLPRPYWAMTTVYIASQPLSGATRSKGLYRFGGTLIGAVACIVMVPNLVDAPELLSLAVALWVGGCLFVSLLDRTARSYFFMLSGYTAALIGFPAVSNPGAIFDTALARAEEITLGIVCATTVSTIVLPRSVGPAVAARIDGWLNEARGLARAILSGRPNKPGMRGKRLKMAAEAADIELLGDHLAHDLRSHGATAAGLKLLHRHMLTLLPLLSTIEDRMAGLGRALDDAYPNVRRLIADVHAWLAQDEVDPADAQALREAADRIEPHLSAEAGWRDILALTLLLRLREFIDLWDDAAAMRRDLAEGRPIDAQALRVRPDATVATVRHTDAGMALWTAAASAAAVMLACMLWIATGWPDGASAAMMAAIICSFFAALDDPTPGMRGMLNWTVVSSVVVAVYLFAILPMLTNVEMLVLALAPAFLLFGYLFGNPATAGIGMPLAVATATLMALQNTYSADFASFINSSLATIVGMALGLGFTRLFRSVGAEQSVRRLMQRGWETLALAAERRGLDDRSKFAGLMLNRIALLAPRLAAIPGSPLGDVDNMRELRVGLNIVDLRRARHVLSERTVGAVDAVLDRLAREFRQDGGRPKTKALLSDIDHALSLTMEEPDETIRRDALIGLSGVRRGLFPDAAPYEPQAPQPRAFGWRIAA